MLSSKKRPDTCKLYTFKVYPEHLGECPLDTIIDCLNGYAFAISPLHSLDYRSDGELKKSHYHINIMFRGAITQNSAIAKLTFAFLKYGGDIVGNFSAPDSVQAARGKQRFLDRYLCHLDHPEKHLYDTKDIYCSVGYLLDIGDSDYTIESEVVKLIFDKKFSTFSELVYYCRMNNLHKELHFVVKNPYFVKQII